MVRWFVFILIFYLILNIKIESYSSRSIWWHYLCITVPNVIKRPNTAFMLIDQGSNDDGLVI